MRSIAQTTITGCPLAAGHSSLVTPETVAHDAYGSRLARSEAPNQVSEVTLVPLTTSSRPLASACLVLIPSHEAVGTRDPVASVRLLVRYLRTAVSIESATARYVVFVTPAPRLLTEPDPQQATDSCPSPVTHGQAGE